MLWIFGFFIVSFYFLWNASTSLVFPNYIINNVSYSLTKKIDCSYVWKFPSHELAYFCILYSIGVASCLETYI